MDVNTMLAAASVGRQDDYDTQIIKEVWADFPTDGDMSNFTKKDFEGETNVCEKAYEAQGSEAYSRCYQAALAANTPEHNALVERYAAAQAKGYSKDFAAFKKKTGTLSAIGDLATGILGSLFGKSTSSSTRSTSGGGEDYNKEKYPEPEKPKTLLYVGIGAVVIIGIGTAIYFYNRKK